MRKLKDVLEDFTLKNKGKIISNASHEKSVTKDLNNIDFSFDLKADYDMGEHNKIKEHLYNTWDHSILANIETIDVEAKDDSEDGERDGWVTITITIDDVKYEEAAYWDATENSFTKYKYKFANDAEVTKDQKCDWIDCYIVLDDIYDEYKQ